MSFALDASALPHAPRPLNEVTDFGEISERVLTRAYAMVAEAERLVAQQRERIRLLEGLSLTDELTGLTNRRGFNAALTRELATLQRDPLATGILILIDLDGFKQINDRFGHAAGDAHLKAVAETLRTALRAGDCLARLGGDEFAILLPRTRSAAGLRRAATLQAYLNAATSTWEGVCHPLRASFGAAPYAADDTPAGLLKRTDARLYANKNQRARSRLGNA